MNTLTNHATNSLLAYLSAENPTTSDRNIFSNYSSLSSLTRNTSHWMHDLNGSTGIIAWNDRSNQEDLIGGAAITPRHIVFTRHARYSTGNTVYFVGRDGTQYSRTVIDWETPHSSDSVGDFGVGLLDSDLPADVEPLKFLPNDSDRLIDPALLSPSTKQWYYLSTGADEWYVTYTNQQEESHVARISTLSRIQPDLDPLNIDNNLAEYSKLTIAGQSTMSQETSAWFETPIGGDSGSPIMMVINGQLVFVSMWSTATTGPYFGQERNYNDINRSIAQLDSDNGVTSGYQVTDVDISHLKQYVDTFDFEFLGDDISTGNNINFRGSFADHNSFFWSIPYAANEVIKTDPRDGSQESFTVPSGIGITLQKWVDVAMASNKKAYACPHGAKGVLVVDTNDPDSTSPLSLLSTSFAYQARGIALDDNGDGTGTGYLASYSGGDVWRTFTYDNSSETLGSSYTYTVPFETDPYYIVRDGAGQITNDLIFGNHLYKSFWGAVNGGNGKIYGIPFGSAWVSTIDTTTNEVEMLTAYTLDGNAPIHTGLTDLTYALKSPQWNKYRAGILADNGCIYSHGVHARAFLKIDTSNDSVQEIAYPHTIMDAMSSGSGDEGIGKYSASFDTVSGVDGKIYNSPWNLPYLISIDPNNSDAVEYIDISDVLNDSGHHTGWYTQGDLINNEIYYAPGIGDRVLKVGLSSYPPAAFSSVTPFVSPSNTPSSTPSATPSPTPSETPGLSPTPSNTAGLPTPTPTGTGTPTPTGTATPTPTPTGTNAIPPTPSATPDSCVPGNKFVEVEYDAGESKIPTRFILSYKDEVILDTGYVGSSDYAYNGRLRAKFIYALRVNALTDFSDLATSPDGYPAIETETKAIKTLSVANMDERDSFMKISTVIENKEWTYRVNCPKDCVPSSPNVTPSVTQTATPTQTPTGTQTPTPTGTPTQTPTPSSTPQPSPTPSISSTPQASPTPSSSVSPTPSVSPSGTPSPSVTPSVSPSGTPSPSPTPSTTPDPSPTPSRTPSPSPPASSTPGPTQTAQPSPTPSSSMAPSPTYTLVKNKFAINEGETVYITLNTTNVPSGTGVPYTITGVDSSDIDVSLTGEFVVVNNIAAVAIAAIEDNLTEGNETFTLTLDGLGVSQSVIIVDTSTNPVPSPTPSTTPAPSPTPSPSMVVVPTYNLVKNLFAMNEGDTVYFTLNTTNIPDGTLVPYTITGVDSSDIDVSLTGSFTINNDIDAIAVTATADSLTEGNETMVMTIDGTSESQSVVIVDTSTTPAPSPTPSTSPSPTPSPSPSPSGSPTPTPSSSALPPTPTPDNGPDTGGL